MEKEIINMEYLKNNNKLPAENDTSGNIEYKRLLHTDDKGKIIKFGAQLNWRITQSLLKYNLAEAKYFIGINDDGSISGENMDSINKSTNTLLEIATNINAEIKSTEIAVFKSGIVALITVSKNKQYLSTNNIRICVIGDSNTGKTTLISVLTYGDYDDGNGSSRNSIFRYGHEFENGKTSSIKVELLGIDNNNKIINYKTCSNSGFGCISPWDNIINKSNTLYHLIDLPGCNKYYKTTMFGLLAYKPDHIFIIYTENTELNNYIMICTELNIPYSIIYTHYDKNNQIMGDGQNDHILNISSVSGHNIDKIYDKIQKIDHINTKKTSNNIKHHDDNIHFMINDVCYIPNIGIVISGIMMEGSIKINDNLLIGPYNNSFHEITIISIHRNQISCNELIVGDSGSLIIKYNISITKHMNIISKNMISKFINKFYIKCDQLPKLNNKIKIMAHISNIYCKIELKYKNNLIHIAKFSHNKINIVNNNDKIIIKYNDKLYIGSCMVTTI
jgi:GTPase